MVEKLRFKVETEIPLATFRTCAIFRDTIETNDPQAYFQKLSQKGYYILNSKITENDTQTRTC